jgi:hypothetical protein
MEPQPLMILPVALNKFKAFLVCSLYDLQIQMSGMSRVFESHLERSIYFSVLKFHHLV